MAQNQSATTFQELSGLLRGQGEGGGARAEGSGGSPQQGNGAKAQQQRAQPGSALTKLADLASTSGPVGAAAAAMAAQFPAQFPAQEQPNLVVAPLQAPLPFPLPAQPGLAGAALSDGQQAGQQAATGEDGRPQQPTAAQVAAQAQAAAAMLAPFGDFAALAHPPMMLMGGDFANMGVFQMQPGEEHLQHMPREKSSKPTRRGPMDEMRQLVRILIKVRALFCMDSSCRALLWRCVDRVGCSWLPACLQRRRTVSPHPTHPPSPLTPGAQLQPTAVTPRVPQAPPPLHPSSSVTSTRPQPLPPPCPGRRSCPSRWASSAPATSRAAATASARSKSRCTWRRRWARRRGPRGG